MSSHQIRGSYGPGYLIRWMQAKKSDEPDQPMIPPKSIAVHDDGRADLEGKDPAVTRWHHDVEVFRRSGIQGVWKPRFHAPAPTSGRMLCLGDPVMTAPCVPPIRRRPTETVRQYIGRAVRENHGYTVPQHWLVDLDAIPDGDTGEPQSGYRAGTNNPTPEQKALLRNISEEFGGSDPCNDVEGS